MASPLVCSALPMTTCSTAAGSTPARDSAARTAIAPRSFAEMSLKRPPGVPAPVLPPTHSAIGVRAPPITTARAALAAMRFLSSAVLEHRFALLQEGGHALAH